MKRIFVSALPRNLFALTIGLPGQKFQVLGRWRRGVLPETRQARRHEEAQVSSPEEETAQEVSAADPARARAAAGGTATAGAQAGGARGTSDR